MKKYRARKQIKERAHQVPATTPKAIPQSELIERMVESLHGDYADFEILDVLGAFGPVLITAMRNYESVRVRGLGEFTFKTSSPRKYYNVASQQFEYAERNYKPVFTFIRQGLRDIQNSVKQLHVETLQQPADRVLSPEEQIWSYQDHIAKLSRWSEGKLKRFRDEAMQDITELSKPDEVQIALDRITEYKAKLDKRYDAFYNDALQKIANLQNVIKNESKNES